MINFINQHRDLLLNLLLVAMFISFAEWYRRFIKRQPKTSPMLFEEEIRNDFDELKMYLQDEERYENIMAARDFFVSKWKRLIKYDTLRPYEERIFDIIKQKELNNERKIKKETGTRRGAP